MKFSHSIGPHGCTVRFSERPDQSIRDCLKRNGFRWEPREGIWYRRRVKGFADLVGALDRMLNPGRPDGNCWICGSPEGRFRPRGAAAPVWCDACNAKQREQEARALDPLGVDQAFEDACRDTCGL